MAPRDVADPKYAQIAASLRQQIESGELAPGARIPSEKTLADEHDVARPTAARAIALLRSEGWITSTSREGSFVKTRASLRVRSSRHYRRPGPGEETSPFARDALREGKRPDWDHETVQMLATDLVAERLGVEPGDRVMRTTYRYLADGKPVQTAVSWEPYDLVGGTEIEFPESPESRRPEVTGVIPRFDLIDVYIDRVFERVHARPSTASERSALSIPDDVWVITIDRTQYAGTRAVEITDIVIPADRYALEYDIPVLGEPPNDEAGPTP